MKKRTKTWLRIVALLLALLLLGSTLYVILDSVIMSAGAVSLDELNEQQEEGSLPWVLGFLFIEV